jgi:hypothetical protein
LDLQLLRDQLHAAIDETFDRLLADTAAPAAPPSDESDVVAGDRFGEWRYHWPDKSSEDYVGRDYSVHAGGRMLTARLGWTTRRAWGRDRRRAVVFIRIGDAERASFYPATEFVETDDGRYASTIPDPARPRSLLKEGTELPARFRDATVERVDAVFTPIEDGPSLRLVLPASDEIGMVRHGYWVAMTRRRI